MPYEKKYPAGFKNRPDTSTPWSASLGTHLENGIAHATEIAEAAIPDTAEGRQAIADSPELSAAIGEVAGKFAGSREQTYNVTGSSLFKFRAAQARTAANGAPCTIHLCADSIGQSTVAPPFSTNSWFARLEALVERRAGAFSDVITFLDVDSQDTRWSRTGTWARLSQKGYVGGQAHTTTQTGATATINGKGDRIIYRYLRTSDAGTFTYSLDGGAAVEVNAYSATEAVGELVLTGSAGALIPHTLVITNGSGRHTQISAEVRLGTTGGYRFVKAAMAGQKVGNFTDYPDTAGSPLNLLKNQSQPDLTIIALETNDWGNGPTAVSTYKAKLATLIEAAQLTGSVLLIATVPPKEPFISPPTTSIEPYNDALYELADEYDCALLNMQERWGTYDEALAAGLMATESAPFYHPSDVGNMDYANAVFDAVFQQWDTVSGIGTIPRTWLARQRFGSTAKSVEMGSYEDGLFPTNAPYILTTAGGNTYLGTNESGKFWQIRTDLQMQAGKLFKSENGNLPAGPFDGWIKVKPVATTSRPTAAVAGAGAVFFDSTLGYLIYSDGTAWRNVSDNTIV